MRIAFFGSSILSAYWNGAATYYRGILSALARRGHEIAFWEPDAFDRQSHRDIEPPEWCRCHVYDPDERAAQASLDQAAAWADVLVKASGVGVLDAFLEAGLLAARKPHQLALFWDVDAPATLDAMDRHATDKLRPLIPGFDAVLTYGGGDPVVNAYRRHGARDCIPIYNALDPETHHPVAPDPRFAADLTFIGNRLPDREARVDAFFLEAARLRPERRFLLGGNGWHDKELPPNVTDLGHVYTRDHNAMNVSALAVLNINRESMATYGFSPPTRVFEAAGAGACLVTDAWEGVEMFLEPGREVLVAASGAEIADHLDRLDETRSRTIGEAARRRLLAEHTYDHRASRVEAVLDGADARPALQLGTAS